MKTRLWSWGMALSTLVLIALLGTGCKNTAHGAGRDIENMGEKLQEKTD